MAPHPIPFPCALALPPPSHRDAPTPSSYWAPHFMTQERLMFSNLTPSEPHLSPAATMSDDMLSALTPPYLHIHLFSKVLHRRRRVSLRRPMYLLIVGSDYCVMRFAYALHMRRQNLVLLSCLYSELLELVIEPVLHYCATCPCHKINLFKRPFRGSRFERLDDAFVLLISLIFLYPQKIFISVR